MNPFLSIFNKAKEIVGQGKESIVPTQQQPKIVGMSVAPKQTATAAIPGGLNSILNSIKKFQSPQYIPNTTITSKEQSKLDQIKPYIPQSILNVGEQVKRGLVGEGGVPDITGKTKFDSGFIGFFRPFGVGKSKEQKVSERLDALSTLVKDSIITPQRAQEIAMNSIQSSGITAVSKGQPYSKKELVLTDYEKKALRPIVIEETIDKFAGALDIIGLGGAIKPVLKKGLIEAIARSNAKELISSTIVRELPIPKNIADEVSTGLAILNDPRDVERVLTEGLKLNESKLSIPKNQSKNIKTTSELRAEYQAAKGSLPKANSAQQAVKDGLTEEQFMKGQGTPVFRGDTTSIPLEKLDTVKSFDASTKESLSAFNNTPGLYFSTSKANALSYGKNLTDVSIKPNANILDVNTAKRALPRAKVEQIVRSNPDIKDVASNYSENLDDAVKQIVDEIMSQTDGNEFMKAIWADGGFSNADFVTAMKNAGIDGLKVPKDGVTHYVVYNKAILKTTPQLRAEYQSALKAKTPTNSAKYVDAKNTKQALKPDTQPPNTVFYKVTKSELKNYQPKDISGITGGKSLVMRDAALSLDNMTIEDAAKKGEWGPAFKIQNNVQKAEAGKASFVKNIETDLGETLRGLSKTDMQVIADFRLGSNVKLTPQQELVSSRITKTTDSVRDFYNSWARANKLPEIGRIENYLPKRKEYGETFVGERKEFKDNFTIERVGGEIPGVQEKDLGKLLGGYVNAVANKIYMESAFNQLKDFQDILQRKGAVRGAKFIDDFVRDMMKVEGKDMASKFARSLISARATSALAFNPLWSLTVQPGSFVLTAARNPGLNIATGSYKAFHPTQVDMDWLKTLPTYSLKTTNSLSSTGLGDIGSTSFGPKLGSRRAQINKTLGWLGDTVEEILSRNAAFVARDYGISKGLKGEALDMYANLMVGATQSEYLKSTRPEALRPLVIRFLAPFQTYAFEVYRFGKTIVGKSGGLPLNNKNRILQALAFVAGTFAYDWLQSKVSGRRITSVGTFIPLAGSVADYTISSITGNEQFGSGRSPVAPLAEADSAVNAVKQAFENNNYNPLRKEMIKWGMGFASVGGASQANRTVDGFLANSRGYHITNSGNASFRVEGVDKVIAPIIGPYGTIAGRDYIEGGFKSTVIKTEKEIAQDVLSKLKSGEFGNEAVAKEYLDSELKKLKTAQQKARLELPPKEFATELLNLVKSRKLTEEEATKELDKYKKQEKKAKAAPTFKDKINPGSEDRYKVLLPVAYAEAFIKDPANAWKALWAGESLGRVEGNLVELRRFNDVAFNKPGGSDEYKKKEMARMGIPWSESKKYSLEHIVPVKSGGDTGTMNLVVIPMALHNSYTPVDNAVSSAVKAGTLTRKEATELMLKFKVEKSITADQVLQAIK